MTGSCKGPIKGYIIASEKSNHVTLTGAVYPAVIFIVIPGNFGFDVRRPASNLIDGKK